MSVLVVDDGNIQSIRVLTAVICPMIKFDVYNPWDYVQQQVQRKLAILYEPSTLSALDLNHVRHLPHALLPEKDTYCLPKGNQ